MEMYKIIVTCNNYTGAGNPRILEWIPENFQGVKITQKFSFVNPIGYTPKFSVETMRAITTDKIWLDAIFDLYGFGSSVTFAIFKLDAEAKTYVLESNFEIDFESYSKLDYYSEFALKSISCIDQYNKIKSAALNFVSATKLTIPTTQNFVNYLSLNKSTGGVFDPHSAFGYLNFIENQDSKIYNNDSALFQYMSETETEPYNIYEFSRGISGAVDLTISAAGKLMIETTGNLGGVTPTLKIYKNDYDTPIYTILGTITVESYGFSILVDINQVKIDDLAFDDADILFIGVTLEGGVAVIDEVLGDFSIEMYVMTELNANKYTKKPYYLTSEMILDTIFDDHATTEASLKSIGVASGQSILNLSPNISIIPKDFLTDFCLANGAIVNFKNDETVEIAKISTYFTNLLDIANAIDVTDFQGVEIAVDVSLNFASVAVGVEQKEYEVYTYLNDWNKILTFIQSDKEASENLNLALTKYRTDFSGILDLLTRLNSKDKSSDLFLFDSTLAGRPTSEGIVYDIFTPRDILENWRTFLSFIFYNYSKDTLTLSSSEGDDFNLQIAEINQFDDFVFSGDTPKILPIKINFTCLIDETDFSESILKINHNGVDLFIFVTEAETTDNLSEQKIKGNLIYFPTL